MARVPSDPRDGRRERKFVVSAMTARETEEALRLHPGMFLEAYPPRSVNNCYFDSWDLSNFWDNADGVAERVKVRIRWYGELRGTIERPVLELKRKHGSVGTKESYPLVPFDADEFLRSKSSVENVLLASEMPERIRFEVMRLEPALVNRYRRKYFESANRKVRVTIDSDLEFYQVRGEHDVYASRVIDSATTVVELKYDPQDDDYAASLAEWFPVRMTRCSKYASGIEFVYG